MNVQKVEQELLKGLQNPPQGRDHGLSKAYAVIFNHPDGGKTYLDHSFLTPFDKGARFYQEHSYIEGRNWSIVAIAETNRITGELEIVGHIVPAKGPKES